MKKKMSERVLAMLLVLAMVITLIPAGMKANALAASGDCLAVKISDKKVYFYGVDSVEVQGLTATYTGGDENIVSIQINGNNEVDTSELIMSARSITFTEEWLAAQSGWVAVQCSVSSPIPADEPAGIAVDETRPIISAVTGNPADWTKDNAMLTVNATDEETNVVAYSKDMIEWQSTNLFTISENGEYSFYVKDAVGNISDVSTVNVEKIDKVAPTISSVSINPNTWTNSDVVLEVTANDDQSGLAEEAYKMDDGAWQTSNEFTISDSEEHTFYVRDVLGNESYVAQTADMHDTIAPIISEVKIAYTTSEGDIEINTDNYTNSDKDYKFTVIASDDKSGVAEYSKDNTDWQSSNEFTMKGASLYEFYVKDNAGNVSVYSLSLKGDDVAPAINSVEPNTTEATNKGVVFTVNAADNEGGAGLATEAYRIDEAPWQESNQFTVTDSEVHTISVRDNTKPENVATTTIRATNFCKEIPTINEVRLSTDKWTKDIIAIVSAAGTKNSASESFSIEYYQMDDGNWQTSNEFIISDCKEHAFKVKDTAGNESKITYKTASNYDDNMPTLSTSDKDSKAISFSQTNEDWLSNILNKLTFGRYFNKKLVISVKAQDTANETSNASGITSAIFKFVDVKEKEYKYEAKEIGNSIETTITFEIKEEDLPNDFKGSAEVILTDAAGNQKSIKVTTVNSNMGEIAGDSEYNFMIENTAPTIDSIEPDNTFVEVEKNVVYKEDYSVKFEFSDKTEGVNNSGLAMVKLEVNGTTVLSKDYQDTKTENAFVKVTTDVKNKKVDEELIDNWNNGKLTYSITVVDNAGNVSETKEVTYCFDQTAPQITGFKFSEADDGYYQDEEIGNELYEAVSVEDYGFYFKNTVKVTVSAEDLKNEDEEAVATGVQSITVYLEDTVAQKLYTVSEDGAEITEITDLSKIATVETNSELSFVVPQDFKGQIYAYATDKVGNSPMDCVYVTDNYVNKAGYVSPDGSIIETTEKHKETSTIKFTSISKVQGTQNNASNYAYEGNAQKDSMMDYVANVADSNVPLYNENPTFAVTVTDSYSGIREVSYTIMEGETQTTTTVRIKNDGQFDGESEGWEIDQEIGDSNLVTKMTNRITVNGNYNDMVLLVELTDRAGNKSYDYYVFGIDTSAPKIKVTYDNNDGDSQSGTGTYFKKERIATIWIQERNFNTEDVKFTLNNAEGVVPKIIDHKLVKEDKEGNGDKNTYEYTIAYISDGVYSFDVTYTDRATNKNDNVDYGDSVAPTQFVIDKTLPTISVSYDNNNAQNEKYFKAHRTATITIVEHNFDVNRVNITQSSALAGNAITNPAVSWVSNGDTHTGTIQYNADGDYTFDITMTDKAGNKESGVNYGNSVAAKEFTVDTTYAKIVEVEGIENEGILKDKATISISINDINLESYSVKLTRSRVLVSGESDNKADVDRENVKDSSAQYEKDVDVTDAKQYRFVTNASGSDNAKVEISIPKTDENGVKNDGVYTLTIKAKDKAGNEYDTDANVIKFLVNRFGSVFTYSEDLYNLITKDGGYTRKVTSEKLTIYEYNATAIAIESENVEIIANNDSKMLERGTDYTFAKDSQQNETSWNKYAYTVKPDNFKKDGVYTIRISSKDAASITSQTVDYDICSATFRVDSTPPEITSVTYSPEVERVGEKVGLAKNNELEVSFTVEDLIGLAKVEVFINEEDKASYTYKDFKDENTSGIKTFLLKEKGIGAQTFKIKATDKAGNVMDTSKDDDYQPGYVFFDHITVSANAFVQFYANQPLFWGTIGGVVVVAGGIWFIIAAKRKKKEAE